MTSISTGWQRLGAALFALVLNLLTFGPGIDAMLCRDDAGMSAAAAEHVRLGRAIMVEGRHPIGPEADMLLEALGHIEACRRIGDDASEWCMIAGVLLPMVKRAAGRAIELDGIVGVVHEIAGRVGVATPNIDALLGLARLFGRVHGLYPEAHAG